MSFSTEYTQFRTFAPQPAFTSSGLSAFRNFVPKAACQQTTHDIRRERLIASGKTDRLADAAANLPRDGVRFVIAAVMRNASVVQAVQSSNSASDRLRESEDDKSCDTSDAAGLGTHLKYDTGQLSQLLFRAARSCWLLQLVASKLASMDERQTLDIKEIIGPTSSTFDVSDRESMGDPEFVDGRVRVMLDEARKALFEADNPRAEAVKIIERYTDEFAASNDDYIQTMSPESQSIFLRARGLGSEDPEVDFKAPVKALVAETMSRFVVAATAFHEGNLTPEMLGFSIDTAVEDCQMLLRGLDNPAD